MSVPDPLPPRFTATLRARLSALFVHSILKGGRQLVEAPGADDDPLEVRVAVDGETLRLESFPELEDAVGTMIGKVRAAVRVVGEPEGAFHPASGRAEIEVPVHIATKHLLARDSTARLSLATDGAVDEPELQAEGDPLDAGDEVVRLVGRGTFEGGSLDGGTLWLVMDAEVADLDAS